MMSVCLRATSRLHQVVVMIAFSEEVPQILKIAKQKLDSKGLDYTSYVWIMPTATALVRTTARRSLSY